MEVADGRNVFVTLRQALQVGEVGGYFWTSKLNVLFLQFCDGCYPGVYFFVEEMKIIASYSCFQSCSDVSISQHCNYTEN